VNRIGQVQSAMRILVLCAQFTSEPETFPVFKEYARKLTEDVQKMNPQMSAQDVAEAQRRLTKLIDGITPELLAGCGSIVNTFAQVGDMVADAVVVML